MPSTVPPPDLASGLYVETASGVFQVTDGALSRIVSVERLPIDDPDFDPTAVVYLPASIVRGIPRVQAEVR